MSFTVQATIKCTRCGGTEVSYSDNPQPDDPVVCTSCGASIRYADFVAQAEQAAADVLTRIMGGKME